MFLFFAHTHTHTHPPGKLAGVKCVDVIVSVEMKWDAVLLVCSFGGGGGSRVRALHFTAYWKIDRLAVSQQAPDG